MQHTSQQPTNQPASQPANQPTNQPTNQSIHQSINRSINQFQLTQPVNRAANFYPLSNSTHPASPPRCHPAHTLVHADQEVVKVSLHLVAPYLGRILLGSVGLYNFFPRMAWFSPLNPPKVEKTKNLSQGSRKPPSFGGFWRV